MDNLEKEKNNIWNIVREFNQKLWEHGFRISYNKWNYKLVDHKLNYTIYKFKDNEDLRKSSFEIMKIICKRYLSGEEPTVAFTAWIKKVIHFSEEVYWCEICECTLKNIKVMKNNNTYNIPYNFDSLTNINELKNIIGRNLKMVS